MRQSESSETGRARIGHHIYKCATDLSMGKPSNIPFVTLDFCADRACASRIGSSVRVEDTSYTPTTPLPVGTLYWRVRSLDSTAAGATWELRIGHRDAPIATTWGNHLDANEDGFADLIVGEDPAPNNAVALVAMYAGSALGLATTALKSMPNPTQIGFATGLAPAGDVDGDGFADLVGAASSTQNQAGTAYVLYGAATGLDSSRATLLFGADGPGGLFGTSARGVGDVNGDGYGDVLIGAPGAVMTAGRAYLFLGGPGGLVTSSAATFAPSTQPAGQTEDMGAAVAPAGDVNGDGYADFAIAAPFEHVLRIYLGGPGAINENAAATIPTSFGVVIASAGDVNGDGYGDLAVANGNTGWVYLGGASGIDTTSPISLQPTGATNAVGIAAADFNGDGYTDLALGFSDSGDGKAFLAYGASNGMSLVDTPLVPGYQLVAGDINGDGYDELLAATTNGQLNIWTGGSTGLAASALTPSSPKIRLPAEPGNTMATE